MLPKRDPIESHVRTTAAQEFAASSARAVVTIAGTSFLALVAESPAQKAAGLEVAESLEPTEGMLFPFAKAQEVTFHMGSVTFPIDILFLSEKEEGLVVAKIVPNVQPGDINRFTAKDVRAVVELNGNSYLRHDIHLGDPCTVKYRVGMAQGKTAQDDTNDFIEHDPGYEQKIEAIEHIVNQLLAKGQIERGTSLYKPHYAADAVYKWLAQNDQQALGQPDEKTVLQALQALKLWTKGSSHSKTAEPDASFKVGDRVYVNKAVFHKNPLAGPHQLNILRQMVQRGGDGKVQIMRIDGEYAQVAGWEGDALLGTLRVPLSALRKGASHKTAQEDDGTEGGTDEKGKAGKPTIEEVEILIEPDPNPDTSYLEQEGFEDRLEELERGVFSYVGVVAQVTVLLKGRLQTFRSGGLWGIEDDIGRDYFKKVAQEEIAQLKEELQSYNVDMASFDELAEGAIAEM